MSVFVKWHSIKKDPSAKWDRNSAFRSLDQDSEEAQWCKRWRLSNMQGLSFSLDSQLLVFVNGRKSLDFVLDKQQHEQEQVERL
jgi:hypothetical protein